MSNVKVTDFIKKTKEFSKFNDMSDDMRDIIKDKVFANKTFFNGIDKIYGTVLYMELPENANYDAGTQLMYSEIYQNDFVLSNTKEGIETTMLDETVLHAELDEERIYVDNYTDFDFYSNENTDIRQDVSIGVVADNEANKFSLAITNSNETIIKTSETDETLISISNDENVDIELEYSIGKSDVVERVEGVYIVIIFPNVKCPAYVRVYNKDLSDDEDNDFIIDIEDSKAIYNNFRSKYDIKTTTKHIEKNNDIAIMRWDDSYKTIINVLKNENVVLNDFGDVVEYHNEYGLNSIADIGTNDDGEGVSNIVVDINGNMIYDVTNVVSPSRGVLSTNNNSNLYFKDDDIKYDISTVCDATRDKYNEYIKEYVDDYMSSIRGLNPNNIYISFMINDDNPNIYKMVVSTEENSGIVAYGFIFDNAIVFNLCHNNSDRIKNNKYSETVKYIIDTDKGLELSCTRTTEYITPMASNNEICEVIKDTFYNNLFGVAYTLNEAQLVKDNIVIKHNMRYVSNELSLEVNYNLDTTDNSFELIDKKVTSDIYTQDDTVFYIRDEFGVPRKYVLE